MEKSTRMKAVACVLSVVLAVVLVVFVASSALARSNPSVASGTYQTGVFSKSYGFGSWIDLNNVSWTTLMSISLPNVPISAYYHVVCDGYAGILNSEAQFAIGVDGTIEDQGTRRFYGQLEETFYPAGIHTEKVYFLTAGSHTFYFLGKIYYGLGSVGVNYHSMVVTIFTDGSATALTTTPQTSVSDIGR